MLSPLELIEKLAALVPPPRLNLVRYHGVLAPNASERKQIVPSPPLADQPSIEPADDASPQAQAHRLTWACLLSRVFNLDRHPLPRLRGPHAPHRRAHRCYLKGVGLPADPPPIAPPRPPPQRELELLLAASDA